MGWSYFPIGIVCPVISEEPIPLRSGLRLRGAEAHPEPEKESGPESPGIPGRFV